MANRIRTGDSSIFNKGRSSKFREGSRVRQTPEEGWRTYWPKRCGNNNNKDEDNIPKNLNDKNCHQQFFQFPQQGRGTYPSFHFLSVLFCGQPGQQSRQFCKFSFFFLLIIIKSGLLTEIR